MIRLSYFNAARGKPLGSRVNGPEPGAKTTDANQSAVTGDGKIVAFREKRHRGRKAMHESLFVQVTESPSADLTGATLSCHAIQTSASGLGIYVDRPIAPGSHLDLWVSISNQPGKFFLSGTVRWQQPDDEGCQVGVELHASAATDIYAWRQLFA